MSLLRSVPSIILFACWISLSSQSLSKAGDSTLIKGLDSLIAKADFYLYDGPDSCIRYTERALKVAEGLRNDTKSAYCLQTKGIAHRLMGHYDSALFFQNKALSLWLKLNDSINIAGAYNNIGIIYDERGINDQAIGFYLKGLAIYEQIGSLDGMAKAYNNLGIVNKKEGNYNKVLDYYERSLSIYQELDHQVGIAITYGNLGSVNLELKDFEKAIEYSNKSIEGYLNNGLERYVGYCLENIGIAYRGLSDLNMAERYHKEALKEYLKFGNEKEATFTRGSLASIYLDKNQLILAENFALECLEGADRMGLLDEQLRANKILYELSKKNNQVLEALQYHEKLLELSDTLHNSQKVKTIEELQVRYDTEKKEQAIKNLQIEAEFNALEISQKRNQIFGLFISAILLLIGMTLYGSRKRYKLRAKLAEEKEQLQKDRFKAVIDAEEKERKRIAQELHDGLGQLLSTARINVSSVGDQENKKLKNSLVLIDQSIHEVRNISHNLMPNALISIGLKSALEGLVSKINMSEQIVTSLTVKGDLFFNEAKTIGIYRVVQEVINNALKYSESDTLELIAENKGLETEFMISDNGKGFDLTLIDKSTGIGWSNIYSRIDLMNGKINISSKFGAGTTVKFTIPNDGK